MTTRRPFIFKLLAGLVAVSAPQAVPQAIAAADWSTFNIEFVGDSLTARSAAGSGSDGSAGSPPGKVAAAKPTATVHNDAVSGRKIADLISNAATFDGRLHMTKTNILICLIGTNDAIVENSAASTYASLVTFLDARKAAGWTYVMVLTMPDLYYEGISIPVNFRSDYNGAIIGGYAAKGYHLLDLGNTAPFNSYLTLGAPAGGADGVHFGDSTIDAYRDLVIAKLEADFSGGGTVTATTINAGTLTVGP